MAYRIEICICILIVLAMLLTNHRIGEGFGNEERYVVLEPVRTVDYTKTMTKTIMGHAEKMYSGTPTIVHIVETNRYLLNIRWINYQIDDRCSNNISSDHWISMNSRYFLDNDLNIVGNGQMLEDDFESEGSRLDNLGLEDLRIIRTQPNTYVYAATYHDFMGQNISSISSDTYDVDSKRYVLNRNIISPTHYDVRQSPRREKNWAPFLLHDELCFVYQWHPLLLGRVNHASSTFVLLDLVRETPLEFKSLRGSSCGHIYNSEIWFIVHLVQSDALYSRRYVHRFVVFDMNMHLLRYSEDFQFKGRCVEFCTSFVINDNEIIIPYSVMDTSSLLSVYTMDFIQQSLRWHAYR